MLAAAAIGADVHTQSLRDVTHHTDLQQARYSVVLDKVFYPDMLIP